MKKMNSVVHFELPADDQKKLADFYSRAFGWDTKFYGEDMGNYVTVATTETDQDGMVKRPGAINGGIYPRNQVQESRPNCPSLVIAVDDIHEHIKIVNDAGGTVLGEPTDIPGVGAFVSFRDPSGNVCSILQPVMPRGEKQEVQEFGLTGEI
ncbi:MAG TPA: VOC family protein [Bacteroidales bacterium]|nr:VOC family protein [Bacteroidales bacterium]